jgi:hypothetical protein
MGLTKQSASKTNRRIDDDASNSDRIAEALQVLGLIEAYGMSRVIEKVRSIHRNRQCRWEHCIR